MVDPSNTDKDQIVTDENRAIKIQAMNLRSGDSFNLQSFDHPSIILISVPLIGNSNFQS